MSVDNVVNAFARLRKTTEVHMLHDRMVNRIGHHLACVKNVGKYGIFVDHFMSNKHYYVLDRTTYEIRYGGMNYYRYLVQELEEELQDSSS